MDPEIPEPVSGLEIPHQSSSGSMCLGFPADGPEKPYRGLKWIFIGPHGLRAGWSIGIFMALAYLFMGFLGSLFAALQLVTMGAGFTPQNAFFNELYQVLSLVAAAGIVALIERRSILDYNLRGPKRLIHFISGLIVGFAAVSAMVGSLAWGGWLRFGPVVLHGTDAIKFAAMWGSWALLVGCMEEGSMRCFLQYAFTRGLNYWWAIGTVVLTCGLVMVYAKSGQWGVYIIALLGILPCLWLHVSASPQAGFWQACWATSTMFGAAHTGNNGENWVGIFAAAFIGFVFCVSIWATGSAWWAIGCHAAWDWAETYFYGTADSGFVAPGHLLTTSPAGNPLWSGGTDGPEGSLLIIPIVLLILAWLLLVYRRPKPAATSAPVATEQLAG